MEEAGAGVPLTRAFNGHLGDVIKSDARNPEVQNRFLEARARNPNWAGPDVSFSGNEADPFFHNTGNGFVEIGSTLGLARTEDGRGFVLVDLDQDGAQDVVVHNFYTNPLIALLNRAAGDARWIRVRLQGKASNRFGIGARVTVASEGRKQVREMVCGSGYLSGNAPELHYGLGTAAKADVTVRWPSGKLEEYRGLTVNRVYTMVEGAPEALRSRELKPVSIEVPDPAPPAPDLDVPRVLAELRTPAGDAAPAGPGPLIAIFFSTTCHACAGDLQRMRELSLRARDLGHKLVWITLDENAKGVEEQFRRNHAPVLPVRPGSSLPGWTTPTVYRVNGQRVEKFSGRHAVGAAFEEAARRVQ